VDIHESHRASGNAVSSMTCGSWCGMVLEAHRYDEYSRCSGNSSSSLLHSPWRAVVEM
jgi:hypothetical protein